MMKQHICILMSAAMLLTAGTIPVYAEETQPVTMPVSVEYTEPQPELYGFTADVHDLCLGEGETYKLQVTLDETYYHTESLRFTSDQSSKASVSADGTITAQETGAAVIRISAKLKEAFADGDPVRTITVKVTVTPDKSLAPEQAEALAALRRKGDRLFGEFQREEMVIRGKYPANAPRLDLETVESVLSDNYAEFRQKLAALQPYPDFIGGSGVSLTEYWFDASGSEKIVLIEPQDSIFYVKCDTAGKVMEWRSFDPQQKELQTGAYLSTLAASYQVYNAVPETLMGDVNGDGTFDIMDLILFQKWLLAVPDTKLVDPSAADFCADGVLDVYDLCLMKMEVVGKYQNHA